MVSEHPVCAQRSARCSFLPAECRVFTHLMLPVQLHRADKPHTVGLVKRRKTRSAAVVALALATIVLWTFLANIQVPGQAHSFIEHIQTGIQHAERDPGALLLFSGGQTRKAAGPRSEAEGYWLVADAAKWWGSSGVRERAFTEEHARDSFENLLFSLCRFYELTGHFPDDLLVIGYGFKHERFADLHRAALKWPDQRFSFVGTPALTATAQEGEHKALEAFRADPFGCQGSLLSKKEERDPFAVGPYFGNRCPDMESLLSYCEAKQRGQKASYALAHLPWDSG